MLFRLYGGTLHVHHCDEHERGCDFFDHAPSWLVANRRDARAQLLVYRRSVVARLSALTLILASIDQILARLSAIEVRMIAQ